MMRPCFLVGVILVIQTCCELQNRISTTNNVLHEIGNGSPLPPNRPGKPPDLPNQGPSATPPIAPASKETLDRCPSSSGKLSGRDATIIREATLPTSWRCCEHCGAIPDCVAWTFDTMTRYCILRNAYGSVTNDSAWEYGILDESLSNETAEPELTSPRVQPELTSPPVPNELPVSETTQCSSNVVTSGFIYSINNLIFAVSLNTTERLALHAEYVPVDQSRPALISPTTEEGDKHTIYMIRLYKETLYQFGVYFKSDCIYSGTFMTGSPPTYIKGASDGRNPRRVIGDPTFGLIVTSTNKPESWFAYDEEGEIVWYLERPSITPNGGFTVTQNHNILHTDDAGGNGGVIEFTMTGEDIDRLETDCDILHHELYKPSSVVFAIGKSRHSIDGLDFDQASDTIVRIDQKRGEHATIFDLIDFVDPSVERSVSSDRTEPSDRHFPCPERTEMKKREDVNDWLHINSVHERSGEIVVSARNTDTLYGFGNTFGEWKLRYQVGSNNFSDFMFPNPHDRFYGQHGAQYTSNGNILLFDNGSSRPKEEGSPYSRGVELELDFEDMEARIVWQYALPIEDGSLCIAHHRGRLQTLENGNRLIFFTQCKYEDAAYLAEVDENETLVGLMREQAFGQNFLIDFRAVKTLRGETKKFVAPTEVRVPSPSSPVPSPTVPVPVPVPAPAPQLVPKRPASSFPVIAVPPQRPPASERLPSPAPRRFPELTNEDDHPPILIAPCCVEWKSDCYWANGLWNLDHACYMCDLGPCDSVCVVNAQSEACRLCCQGYDHEINWNCNYITESVPENENIADNFREKSPEVLDTLEDFFNNDPRNRDIQGINKKLLSAPSGSDPGDISSKQATSSTFSFSLMLGVFISIFVVLIKVL